MIEASLTCLLDCFDITCITCVFCVPGWSGWRSSSRRLATSCTPTSPQDSAQQIEDLVQSELSKHSQLDDQSRLIIKLTVSITAQILSTHSHQNSPTTITNSPQDETIARIDQQHNKFETELNKLSDQLQNKFSENDQSISELKSQITQLNDKVSALTHTNSSLQYSIDDVDQYERRDTLVFSGKSIPKEIEHENTSDVIIKVLRQTLFMNNISRSDINVCHRLGGRRRDSKGNPIERPIICKFISRTVKREIKQSCLDLKPDLYANESLTNIRREIFTKLRFVRKSYREETRSELFPLLLQMMEKS